MADVARLPVLEVVSAVHFTADLTLGEIIETLFHFMLETDRARTKHQGRGPDYPLNGRWWAYDKQRNRNAGATLEQGLGRVRLDLSWNLVDTRGLTSYRFASPVALAYFADGLSGGDSGTFPAMRYRVDSLSLGASVALTSRVSLRAFDLFERGRIADWHYLGLDAARVIDHRVYSDGGPSGYTTNLIGVLLDLRL